MKKTVKIVLLLVIVALLIIAGVSIIKKKKAEAAKVPAAIIYPIVSKVISPKVGDVTLTLPYLAVVGNDADIMVASKLPARVEMIKKSGEKVKKGELIAKLDTTELLSNIESIKGQISAAKIALANLIQTHKRTKKLLAVGGASIEQSQKEASLIAATKAKVSALKEKLRALNNNLSAYAQIVSPVDGVVSKAFATVGAMEMPGKPLLQISAEGGKNNYLLVRAPGNVNVKGVIFRGKSYAAHALGSSFHGLLEYKVYVDAGKLTSGDREEVSVVIYHDKAILLPFDAVLNRDGKSYVLVAKEKKAEPQEVHILESGEEGVVIKENIEGKKIVLAKPDILLKLVSGYALKVKGE